MPTARRRSATSPEAIGTWPTPERPWPWWGPASIETIPLPEIKLMRGYVADPVPTYYLLDKAKMAQLKVRQLDLSITELEKQIDFLKLERDLLRQEYKLK